MIEILRKYNSWHAPPTNIGFRREWSVNALSGYLDNALVKVILGQRWVGKSYLIRMFIEYLIAERRVPAENILYINKDIRHPLFLGLHLQLFNYLQNVGAASAAQRKSIRG